MGVQQSRGWVHYAVHRPEPHIMLFRCGQVERRQRGAPQQLSPESRADRAAAQATAELRAARAAGGARRRRHQREVRRSPEVREPRRLAPPLRSLRSRGSRDVARQAPASAGRPPFSTTLPPGENHSFLQPVTVRSAPAVVPRPVRYTQRTPTRRLRRAAVCPIFLSVSSPFLCCLSRSRVFPRSPPGVEAGIPRAQTLGGGKIGHASLCATISFCSSAISVHRYLSERDTGHVRSLRCAARRTFQSYSRASPAAPLTAPAARGWRSWSPPGRSRSR